MGDPFSEAGDVLPGWERSDAGIEERLAGLSPSKQALFAALRRQRDARATPADASAFPPGTAAVPGVELLRPGTGAPLVLVHPVGGELFCYGELVRRLRPGYPVWGLAADDLLRETPPVLTELALHYLDRLARAGIRPAMLAGWSFGGMVAYEMARMRETGGEPCPVLVIDAMPQATGAGVDDEAELMRDFAADLIRSAGRRPEEAGSPEWDPRVPSALDRLRQEFRERDIPLDMTGDELAARLRVYVNAAQALRRHHPAPDGPPLRLVWATGTAADLTPWWRGVTGRLVSGTGLPADHYSLLRPPVVDELAGLVHDAMTAKEGRNVC
ncbi:alpha/beta fold hydrolase [Nonomuraea sp. NPDC052116]|uniref:thioesterase domain-containing protein n=1 Tax=Nonomuraea sp. NPDC052116 TaxID=3155665 RepID=UPI00341C2924